MDTSPDAFPLSKDTAGSSEDTFRRDGDRSARTNSSGKGEASVAGGVTRGGEDGRRVAAEARYEAAIAATGGTTATASEKITGASLRQQKARLNHVVETEQEQQRAPRERLQQHTQHERSASAKDRDRSGLAASRQTKSTSTRETRLSPSAPSFFPPSVAAAALQLNSEQQQQQQVGCEQRGGSNTVLCAGFETIGKGTTSLLVPHPCKISRSRASTPPASRRRAATPAATATSTAQGTRRRRLWA